MKAKLYHLISELKAHLPYTIFSVCTGLAFLGMLTFITTSLGAKDLSSSSQGLFHVFHPVHMPLSLIATTAIFWRHEKKVIKALVIGFVGAVGVCGLSDIIIPYVSGYLLGVKMHLHIRYCLSLAFD